MVHKHPFDFILSSYGTPDKEVLASFLAGLPDDYLTLFSESEIHSHCRYLLQVSRTGFVYFNWNLRDDGVVCCRVIAPDFLGAFYLIVGVLAASGFNIQKGEVLTSDIGKVTLRKQRGIGSRYILDIFEGDLFEGQSKSKWAAVVKSRLTQVFQLAMAGQLDVARDRVIRWVSDQIAMDLVRKENRFYPVKLSVTQMSEATVVDVFSQDTPFFLFALVSALACFPIAILRLSIRTQDSIVADQFLFVDSYYRPISDQRMLDSLRVVIVLTKQFSFYLNHASQPYDALIRFGRLIESLLLTKSKKRWLQWLQNPSALKELARVLGTSDLLWESFIQTQYESVFDALELSEGRLISQYVPLAMKSSLRHAIQDLPYDDVKQQLNLFKDRMTYLVDVAQIVGEISLWQFSSWLTRIADAVISVGGEYIYQRCCQKWGKPVSDNGDMIPFSLFGLGKLGGRALGYASDLELMLVYGGSGKTTGEQSISTSRFFSEVARELNGLIVSKKHGIFELDFRLRPYGSSGPIAVSLSAFNRYYSLSGEARVYEKMALTAMRIVGGSWKFGQDVLQLRDCYVYSVSSKDQDYWSLRYKQWTCYKHPNAKYSSGALVDIEYGVQLLQMMNGGHYSELRKTQLRDVMTDLGQLGIVSLELVKVLQRAYLFYRRLINAMRMLRGNAKDLQLPPMLSTEYDHLSRRMQYFPREGITLPMQLHIDRMVHSAHIRWFLKQSFGERAVIMAQLSVADIMLQIIPSQHVKAVLTELGAHQMDKFESDLVSLYQAAPNAQMLRMGIFVTLLIKERPEKDRLLSLFCQYCLLLPNLKQHINTWWQLPIMLQGILDVFSASNMLTMAILRHPNQQWFSAEKQWLRPKSLSYYRCESERVLFKVQQNSHLSDQLLKRYHQQSLCRLVVCDISMDRSVIDITHELSYLAESIVQVVLTLSWSVLQNQLSADQLSVLMSSFTLIGLGKLGAIELNYSSDIDLLPVYDAEPLSEVGITVSDAKSYYRQVLSDFSSRLTTHTDEGFLYRVDFNLRPHGRVGEWAFSLEQFQEYFSTKASSWELQMMLKARPVGGSMSVGKIAVSSVFPTYVNRFELVSYWQAIKESRSKMLSRLFLKRLGGIDVKNGYGGIRDIEFLVQYLILRRVLDGLLTPPLSTIEMLQYLVKQSDITDSDYETLRDAYLFFRRLEHYLQLVDNRQVHSIPKDKDRLMVLAHRMLGELASIEQFNDVVMTQLQSVQQCVKLYLGGYDS